MRIFLLPPDPPESSSPLSPANEGLKEGLSVVLTLTELSMGLASCAGMAGSHSIFLFSFSFAGAADIFLAGAGAAPNPREVKAELVLWVRGDGEAILAVSFLIAPTLLALF